MSKLVDVRVEKSKSKSGRHSVYYNAFIVSRDCTIRQPKLIKQQKVKPTYRRGEAIEAKAKPPDNIEEVLVKVRFVKNLWGRVRGEIEVYNNDGELVLKTVYRKLKIRRSKGDPEYGWAIECLMDKLKLPVKRYNFETGVD